MGFVPSVDLAKLKPKLGLYVLQFGQTTAESQLFENEMKNKASCRDGFPCLLSFKGLGKIISFSDLFY